MEHNGCEKNEHLLFYQWHSFITHSPSTWEGKPTAPSKARSLPRVQNGT